MKLRAVWRAWHSAALPLRSLSHGSPPRCRRRHRNRHRLPHLSPTGIADYLSNGGRIEVAQRLAGHASTRTTGLYDRRHDQISVGEIEKIGI
jgi:integrase